jgi:Fe-S-cluster containining protein
MTVFGGTMKVFLDGDNKINYDKIDKDTTVKDFLEAVDLFSLNNPVSCFQCEESCCRQKWSVSMDNICVNRLCSWNKEEITTFVKDKLIKRNNFYRDFNQYILNKDKDCSFIDEENRCIIYGDRPIICRLYFCQEKSSRYNTLRELAGSVYLNAMFLEYRINTNSFSKRTIEKYKRNPAVFASDYDTTLDMIIEFAETEGWLYPDEKEALFENLN